MKRHVQAKAQRVPRAGAFVLWNLGCSSILHIDEFTNLELSEPHYSGALWRFHYVGMIHWSLVIELYLQPVSPS